MIVLDINKTLQAAEGVMNLDLQLNIPKGSLTTLYGDSGAGKTSTLRLLAGLLKPDRGKITVSGRSWYDSDSKINLPPQQRNIGYVFQDYALFPNMTVLQNLEFAADKTQGKKAVENLIEIMELGELQQRKPHTLSGGQQQRVALARALVQQPEILLLDEPLAALDHTIRLKLQDYIQKVHAAYGLTTILISHDVGEIVKLSDKVVVLEKGKISRQGSPTEIFMNKKLSGKFQFTGQVLQIEKQEVIFIVTVLINTQLIKVIARESDILDLKLGDKVVVASKAFNPIIYKIV